MNRIFYEWCYETLGEHGDIIDCDFEDRLRDFQPNRKTDTLCLLRREGDEANGETDRLWAYVENGKLPESFSDAIGTPTAILIPKKYHIELSKNAL